MENEIIQVAKDIEFQLKRIADYLEIISNEKQ